MEIFKNDKEAFMVFAMKGEANVSNIKFRIDLSELNIEEKKNDDDSITLIYKKTGEEFNIDDLLVIIQFKDDYLTNIPQTDIKAEIKDGDLGVTWLISKAMTLKAQDREFQLIIKNKSTEEIFKSYKSIFRVQKSIDDTDKDCECDTTCIAGMLEQWNIKMREIVEAGGVADLSQYAKTVDIEDNYYNKTQIDNTIEPLISKQEVTKALEPYALEEEVVNKTENLQPITDDNLATTDKTIVGAINELKNSIPQGADLSNYYNKAEVDTKVDAKQNKTDNTLKTTNKTVIGAINELKDSIPAGADLSDYYNKATVDSKLSEKQDKTDNALATTDKTVVGAINELKDSMPQEVDLSVYYNKTEMDNKLGGKQDKTDNSLATTDKTVVGAINELKGSIPQAVDLSNYYNKTEVDAKVDTKQNKTDDTLETTSKEIVGAINEVNTLAKNNSGSGTPVDLSNYYTKADTYNKTEVDNKLATKLDKSVYEADKPTYQLKEDNTLNTTSKNVVGAINELNTNKIALTSLSGTNGIEYNNTNGQISAKVDGSSIKVNSEGKLEVISNGGVNNAFGNSNAPAEEGSELTLAYHSRTNNAWSDGNFPYNHTGSTSATDKGYLILKVDRTSLDESCSVLKITPTINGLGLVGTATKNGYVQVYARVGGEYNSSSNRIEGYVYTELLAMGTIDRGSSPNLIDSGKTFYVYLPKINNNEIYIDIYASEDTTTQITSIEVVQMLNTNPNLLLYNNGNPMPIKTGLASSMYIGNGGIIEKSTSSYNLSYGFNALKMVNSDETKGVGRTIGIGQNTGINLVEGQGNVIIGSEAFMPVENANYNVVLGSFTMQKPHTAQGVNFEPIKKVEQCVVIGDYCNPKTNTPINENILGYNAKGNGNHTFTIGNSEITAIYAQVSSITQFSDTRLKEEIKDVDINQVISNIKGLKVIHAKYKDLEEFIGNNENDKHKLMFEGESYRNSFGNDTKLADRVFHPIDPTTHKRKLHSIETMEEGKKVIIQSEEVLDVKDCIEITTNQLLPALVVTNQHLLKEIDELKETIKNQTELINRMLTRIEALEKAKARRKDKEAGQS